MQTTIDPAGLETRYVYDTLGRRVRTIANYVVQGSSEPEDWLWDDANQRWEDGANNAINQGNAFDQNLISESSYDRAGRVIFTRDARSTKTVFTYDAAGRRLTVIQAAETSLATTSYTCYDKAGRVLRTITHYVPLLDENEGEISPDAMDEQGNWLFNPATHGQYNDQNLITVYHYDRLGRRVGTTDPLGNHSKTIYLRSGQPKFAIDAENIVTRYGYDRLQRRTTVAQGYRAFPIAFVSSHDAADGDIYVLNPLDGETQRITNTGEITWGPAWSPDGRQIAFYDQRSNPTSYQIYVMDADGDNLQAITTYPDVNADPAWSPDASQFAFVSDNPLALYLMDADGSNPQLLYQDTVNLYHVRSPHWSPDGQKIVFHLQDAANPEDTTMADVYIINANGYRIDQSDSIVQRP